MPKSTTDQQIGLSSGIRVDVTLWRSGHFMGPETDLSDMASDSQRAFPVGGRLQHFYHQWESSTTDAWVLQTVKLGLTQPSSPPNRFIQCPVSCLPAKRGLMEAEIQHLLDTRPIEPVPKDQEGTSFYSIFFSHAQEFRGLERDIESQATQQFHSVQVIQNAIPQGYLGKHTEQGFLDIGGTQGGLPTHSGPSPTSKVPTLHICQSPFSILSHAVQHVIGPKDIYQTISGGSCDYPIGPGMPTV